MGKTNKAKNDSSRSLFRSKQQRDPCISKLQLSLLNSGLLNVSDGDKATNLIPQKPIELHKFPKHVENLRKYDILLKTEFQVSTKGESHSVRHALKPGNELKNSYKKLIPFDFNRVVLETIHGVPDSDYVNASYIDSIVKPNAYIAAQGPNEYTIADFWRMVWEQNSYVIVMLTKVFDFIRVMCVQYWPSEINQSESYGDLETILLSEEMLANFLIRTIRLRKGDEVRDITQLHYTNWPSHTCPFSSALLEFRRRVRIYMSYPPNSGPTIVHCSDGCGRTGTYLCIDANLELAEEDNVYDAFGYTKKLRQSRRGMVENVDHYRFIHETLEEAHVCGITWFPVTQISQQLKHKSMKNPITKQNEYQREYEKICKMASKLSIGDCAGGHRPENREKNRDVAIVPPDNFRPYLTSFQSNDNTDYINAVFVDGYTRPKEYIVTEWPLQKTIADFWSLVYDHECNSVIVLCSPVPCNAFPPFWPTEREKRKKYGPVFTVELVSYNHYPNIKTWIFKILKKIVSLTELMAGVKAEPRTTQLFQLTCWPVGHKVPTSTNALVELMNMVERWRQRTEYGPVVVLSANGRSRVGVYCAANVATEQVVQHREVDIFQAVKTVRRHRPQLVENMTEYKYCYDLVLHYILHYLHKE
ncbi:receptor-type tyrosine-protein phosphatase mu-like isoform X2 [Centruroides sculpturatus]|uniref:receptor-type tyrosine-protein phosphatase mu-like isoform X2 n=1 Tax=Centruroides sculpturatus TaxID=218467 RepID=UPI000C6D792F|nr:receptor-type tyrosine-protein phosphatase mu-like isoform X2 [Centruroides sculpturatus]